MQLFGLVADCIEHPPERAGDVAECLLLVEPCHGFARVMLLVFLG